MMSDNAMIFRHTLFFAIFFAAAIVYYCHAIAADFRLPLLMLRFRFRFRHACFFFSPLSSFAFGVRVAALPLIDADAATRCQRAAAAECYTPGTYAYAITRCHTPLLTAAADSRHTLVSPPCHDSYASRTARVTYMPRLLRVAGAATLMPLHAAAATLILR